MLNIVIIFYKSFRIITKFIISKMSEEKKVESAVDEKVSYCFGHWIEEIYL